MIIDQNKIPNLREIFEDAVKQIFLGKALSFLDYVENDEYSIIKYDCYIDYNDENYIINRETGEYVNWYKFDHIGRCINVSITEEPVNVDKDSVSAWIFNFLQEFKESGNEA